MLSGCQLQSRKQDEPMNHTYSHKSAGSRRTECLPLSELVSSSGDTTETAGAPAQPSMLEDDKDGGHPSVEELRTPHTLDTVSHSPCLRFQAHSAASNFIRITVAWSFCENKSCVTLSGRSLVCHPSIHLPKSSVTPGSQRPAQACSPDSVSRPWDSQT